MNDPNLARYRDFLIVEFNEDQLASLCQDVGLNYADLPGTGAYGKTRELIEIAQSRHVLGELMNRTRELRPDAYRNANIKEVAPESDILSDIASFAASEGVGAVTGDSAGGIPAAPGNTEVDPLPPPIQGTPQEQRAALIATLTPRVRLLAILVGLLLIVVAVLAIVLPKSGSTMGNAEIPDATTLAISATQMADEATAQVLPTLAPAVVATVTQPAANASPVPVIQATTAVSDAASAVRLINNQLVEFYTGKVDAGAIKIYFGAIPLRAVNSFAYTKLKRMIGVDLTKGDAISVTMRYVNQPRQVSASGRNFSVSSTEYWDYTNPQTSRSFCDTSNYYYVVSKNGTAYQIIGLRSSLVSNKCD